MGSISLAILVLACVMHVFNSSTPNWVSDKLLVDLIEMPAAMVGVAIHISKSNFDMHASK
jgi:hypothetical protein